MSNNSTTALITGGTSGIGWAAAKKLAQLGIHVIVVGRDEARGQKAVEGIRAPSTTTEQISTYALGPLSRKPCARTSPDAAKNSNAMIPIQVWPDHRLLLARIGLVLTRMEPGGSFSDPAQPREQNKSTFTAA